MSSLASTLRAASPEEVTVDDAPMCSLGGEPPNPNMPLPSSLSPSPSPSPPPSRLGDFEYIGFLPGLPANLVIRTRDASERWFAHREILKFTQSEKLARLADSPTTIVYLDIPSGAARTLLEWIYPHTSMHVTTFDALDAALFAAINYKLDAMRDSLRALFDQPDSPVRIRADPIRAYGIASKHGLTSDAQEAARLVVGRIDFMSPGALETMVRSGVSVECGFRLVQRQLAWESALSELLLKTTVESPCYWDSGWIGDKYTKLVACGECTDRADADASTEDEVKLVRWQKVWAKRLHERLACTPFDKCNHMFRAEHIIRMRSSVCEQCLVYVMRNPEVAEGWMNGVRTSLYGKWKAIFDIV